MKGSLAGRIRIAQTIQSRQNTLYEGNVKIFTCTNARKRDHFYGNRIGGVRADWTMAASNLARWCIYWRFLVTSFLASGC